MLFFNQKLLILLNTKYLDVYQENNKTIRLNFENEVVRSQEITNPVKFNTQLEDFFKKNNLKSKEFLIVLGNDLVYEKKASPTANNFQVQLTDLLQELPFDPADVVGMVIKSESGNTLVGTNATLYKAIKTVIEKTGGKLNAVVPGTIFTETQKSAQITGDSVKNILNEKSLIETNNFLKTNS